MIHHKIRTFTSLVLLLFFSLTALVHSQNRIRCAAERTELYLPLLTGKNVGVIANHTSLINNTHLVDSLIDLGVHVVRIFSPEHG